ncbi:MAG: hypothetical protein JW866_10185 [Ignavibacteriales bacterium]|nr:hypothetical protein [Ignavibacteriales bacterium]
MKCDRADFCSRNEKIFYNIIPAHFLIPEANGITGLIAVFLAVSQVFISWRQKST